MFTFANQCHSHVLSQSISLERGKSFLLERGKRRKEGEKGDRLLIQVLFAYIYTELYLNNFVILDFDYLMEESDDSDDVYGECPLLPQSQVSILNSLHNFLRPKGKDRSPKGKDRSPKGKDRRKKELWVRWLICD